MLNYGCFCIDLYHLIFFIIFCVEYVWSKVCFISCCKMFIDAPSIFLVFTTQTYDNTNSWFFADIQEEFRKPSSLLHVVEPGYLMFVVYPGKRWILETGRRYVVNVHIFDYNSHRIHPSDNLRLKVIFPTQFFRVLASTANGTHHLVETLKAGSTTLQVRWWIQIIFNDTSVDLVCTCIGIFQSLLPAMHRHQVAN